MRRGRSSARSSTSATRSSRPGRFVTSTTSTPSFAGGGTTAPTRGAIPSNATGPWPSCGPRNNPGCSRCRRTPFETALLRVVRSGKTPSVRFDRNQYSIPHALVRQPLTLVASGTQVRGLDGQIEVARHWRSYDTGQTIEDPAHFEGLLAATRQANVHTARDRLRVTVPVTATLFERLAARGEALRPHAVRLLALLDDDGPQELTAAITLALERDALGAGSIAHLLETRRRQRGRKPPLRLVLPARRPRPRRPAPSLGAR